MDREVSVTPPSQTPKSLVRQAAEAISHQIVLNCHAALVKCLFHPDEEVRESMIVYLKRLKGYYWNDKYGLVEYYRRHISDVFTDVMELHSSKVEALPVELHALLSENSGVMVPSILVTLAAQVLFTFEVGYSSAMDMIQVLSVRSTTARIFNGLLEAVVPFHLERLSTAFIKFEESAPVLTLLKHSPYLKHVFLVNNSSVFVFNSLRMYGKNIETLYFKLFAYYAVLTSGSSSSDILFETFFGGLRMDDVIQSLDSKEKIVLSFPKLKEVVINNNNSNTCVPITEFMHCLQHLYPLIKTRWVNFINIHKPSPELPVSAFRLHSPFLRKEKYNWDVLQIGYVNELELLEDTAENYGEYPTVNHIVIEVDAVFSAKTRNFVKDLMKRHQCMSIELVLYKHSLFSNSELASVFHEIGNILQTLCLNLLYGVVAKELVVALNSCSALQVLSLETNLEEYDYSQSPFNTFPKLNSLSLTIHSPSFPSKAAENFQHHLITAAPFIRTLKTSYISEEGLERMDVGGLLYLNALHIGSTFPRNLRKLYQKASVTVHTYVKRAFLDLPTQEQWHLL
ncbi:uncharacterized protein LOC135205422 [Macrobrachium nipponense]|uniref:uncharacterized protein LOC135205422 n=1 Tax=Macrobrachium nipponense TaxID=159736 RepID=UPI0030C89B9A